MKPLTISPDQMMFLEDGHPWIQRGCLDWPAYGRHLHQGAAWSDHFFEDRARCGANTVALAGMLAWFDLGFNPSEPNYWGELHPFCDIAEQHGIRLQWVVLCDTKALMPDLGAQLAHWQRFLTHLGARNNCTFIVANQPDHPSQTITQAETLQFAKVFPGQLCARNNPFESANPVLPPMDFSCYCSTRNELGNGYRAWALSGTDLYYVVHGWPEEPHKWNGTRQVSIAFEPYRIEEGTIWMDPHKARFRGRALSAPGTGGGNIYSRQGRNADLFTGTTRACVVEFCGNIPKP